MLPFLWWNLLIFQAKRANLVLTYLCEYSLIRISVSQKELCFLSQNCSNKFCFLWQQINFANILLNLYIPNNSVCWPIAIPMYACLLLKLLPTFFKLAPVCSTNFAWITWKLVTPCIYQGKQKLRLNTEKVIEKLLKKRII